MKKILQKALSICVLQGFLARGKFSACDHVASLRDLKVEGTTVSMELRGRAFVLKLPSAQAVNDVVSAVNSVSLMLFCGPPPYKTTNVDLKMHQIVTPSPDFVISNNLPPGKNSQQSDSDSPY